MTFESDRAGIPRDHYASETRRRMTRTVCDLEAILRSETSYADNVLRQLREQEAFSRRAGLRGISRLCRDMAGSVAEACAGEPSQLAGVAATQVDICRIIQSHANELAHRTSGIGSGDVTSAFHQTSHD